MLRFDEKPGYCKRIKKIDYKIGVKNLSLFFVVDVIVMWIQRCWLALHSHAPIWSLWRSRLLILRSIGSMGIIHVLNPPFFFQPFSLYVCVCVFLMENEFSSS